MTPGAVDMRRFAAPPSSSGGVSTCILMCAAPLDALRTAILRALPVLRPFITSRARRVVLAACAGMALTLALTLVAPFWVLALTPIVFGPAHLVGDVRYLVVRQRLLGRPWLPLLVGIPLCVTAGTGTVHGGMAAVCVAAIVARGSWWRRTLIVALAALAWAFLGLGGALALAVLAHGHNAFAVGLWWLWRRRSAREGLVLVVFAVISAGILAGAFDDVLTATGALERFAASLPPGKFERGVAPVADGVWAARLLVLFAFMQSVHYSVWLRLIPEDDRAQPTPRTWGSSLGALVDDLGATGLAAACLGAVTLAVWAAFDLASAHTGYLRFAWFHGFLEFAVAAVLFVEQPARPQSASVRA